MKQVKIPKEMPYKKTVSYTAKPKLKKQGFIMKHIDSILLIISVLVIIGLATAFIITEQNLTKSQELAGSRLTQIITKDKEIVELKNTKLSLENEIKDFTNEVVSLNTKIADKDYEIKRLGGVVSEKDRAITDKNKVINEKDRTISVKDDAIKITTNKVNACKSDLDVQRSAGLILAGWSNKFQALGLRFNKAFIDYSNYVITYLPKDDADRVILNGITDRHNQVSREYNYLIDQIEN